jgi:hypothetical protein
LSRDTALGGAESKDPEGAYLVDAVRTLSNTEAATWRTRHGLSPGPRTRTGSILLCPAATSTFSAAIAREKQLKGWRREKKLNLIRTIAGRILYSGLGGRKHPNGIDKISTVGVLRLRAANAVHTINL